VVEKDGVKIQEYKADEIAYFKYENDINNSLNGM
jgi:hypothetical protein